MIDGEAVEVRVLTRIVAELADLLGEIDASLSADARESPRWEIAGMSRPEPARTVTKLRRATGAPDGGREAAAACVAGVRSLGERPARPPFFSDEALRHVDRIAHLSIPVRIEVAAANPSGGPDRTSVFPIAGTNAIAALSRGDGDGGYEEYGSVEGPAEALDTRGEPYFTVRDALAGLAVRCYFGEHEREEVARAVAGRRIVSVNGMLHRDRAGRTRRIGPVRSVAVIDEPLPGEWASPAGLFRGIGDTQAYLRDIRGG